MKPRWLDPVTWRLFATVWLVYSLFATTNVVRETYLAMSLGSNLSARVDAYAGLHDDLFEIPGRGWYINSNPGTSMIAAIPYGLLIRPAIALATRIAPGIAEPRPPAAYDDPRATRTVFMNLARARGLDIVLGLAAIGTAVTLMAPLGAAATVLLFLYLRARLPDERRALWYAVAFAFVTPQFFRAAFINQNAVVAHLVLGSYVLMTGLQPRPVDRGPGAGALAGIGALLGLAVVCDYSAIPYLLTFGLWILADARRRDGAAASIRAGSIYTAGALPAIALLLAYQWLAFGNPVWPAQRYMPPTEYSVRGWFGFTLPTPDLLWANLFDLRYGLFAFCPLLLLALATPLVRRAAATPTRDAFAWIWISTLALLVFSSANQFANLQWNTGVRYMVPAAPLLYLAAVPVLEAIPRLARWSVVGLSGVIMAAVTMTREDVPTALRLVFSQGPDLPVLIVLRKMASGYERLQLPGATFWIIAAVVATVLWLLWRGVPRPGIAR
jgi:hypothetical protein